VRRIRILRSSHSGHSRKFALTELSYTEFWEVRLAPGAREENSDSFRADDPLFPKIRERVRL
jgi:hypothetical protein